MFLLGSIVDAIAILVGSTIGFVLPNIPERMQSTIMQGLGLCVVLIGLSMALNDISDILLIIISTVLGAIIGELIHVEGRLENLGKLIESRIQRWYQGPIAESFVAGSLLFCIGSMSVVGAIQDGVNANHNVLFAKSILDMVSSVVFGSTLGIGVALSAIPVFIYEGGLAVLAHVAGTAVDSPAIISCLTATGGLMIVGLGLNVYGVKKILIGNLLPGLFVAPLLKFLVLTSHLHIG